MDDKRRTYVKVEDVLYQSTPIEKLLAEEYDRMISKDIVAVIKKYFPRSALSEERVMKLTRALLDAEKGSE